MGSQAKLEFFDETDFLFGRVSGALTEDSGLTTLLPGVRGRRVLLHAGNVSRINSCGVRDWVRWIQGLEERSNQVFLVDLSPVMVSQLNMVRNFAGAHGQVVSVLIPYFCVNCDRVQLEQQATDAVEGLRAAPDAFCEVCGSVLDFDDLPDVYFAFTRGPERRAVDKDVVARVRFFEQAYLANQAAALTAISSGTRLGSSSAPLEGGLPAAGVSSSEAQRVRPLPAFEGETKK